MRNKLIALVVVMLALTVANWNKFRSSTGKIHTEAIQVVSAPPSSNPWQATRLPENSKMSQTTQTRTLETRLQDLAYRTISSARIQNAGFGEFTDSSIGRRNVKRSMSFADFQDRTDFKCSRSECIMAARPGSGKDTDRELVAMLVTIESGVKNKDLSNLGLSPGKIKAQIVGGVPVVNIVMPMNS